MALTPEEALYDAIDSAGSEAKKKYRDVIHLPFFFCRRSISRWICDH